MELESERLCYRSPTMTDTEDLREIGRQKTVIRWLHLPLPVDRADVQERILAYQPDHVHPLPLFFVIVEKRSQRVIGWIDPPPKQFPYDGAGVCAASALAASRPYARGAGMDADVWLCDAGSSSDQCLVRGGKHSQHRFAGTPAFSCSGLSAKTATAGGWMLSCDGSVFTDERGMEETI